MKVVTLRGLVDLSSLEVRDIVSYEEDARVIATEYTLDGELVRRDVHVSLLRGLSLLAETADV